MADASWDNGGMGRPVKKGMPVWGKILMGCGVVVLLGVAGCAVGIASCAGAVKNAGNAEWENARVLVQQLETDEGAAAVYAANPGLARSFADEAAFVAAAQGWRPRLEPLPPQMPDLLSGKIDLNVSFSNNHRTVELNYTNGKGARMATEWRDGQLADITVN
jgi:hypothetical protein